MTIQQPTRERLEHAFSGQVLPGGCLTGTLAFGIETVTERVASHHWFCCRFESGKLVQLSERDDLLDVIKADGEIKVLMALPAQAWAQLGAAPENDFPRLLERLSPRVSGHLAYFIRHLPDVVHAAWLASAALGP